MHGWPAENSRELPGARPFPRSERRRKHYSVTDEADAVFVAGERVPAVEVVDRLETELGKPTIGANQKSFWKLFDALDIDPELDSHGELMKSQSKPKADSLAATRKST
jgi:maleate cis-trans isomerase